MALSFSARFTPENPSKRDVRFQVLQRMCRVVHTLQEVQQAEKGQCSYKNRNWMEAPGIPKRHVGCEVKDILNDPDQGAGEYPRYGERHTGMIFPVAPLSTSFVHAILWRRNLEPQNRLRDAVLILRGSKLDLCFRLCQLRLAELNNRTQPQAVASLR